LGGCQAGTLCCGEHLRRVLECARGRNQHIGRHRDAHIKAAVLQIELSLTEVLLGIPAPHVIVHSQAGIPLRHFIDVAAIYQLDPHPIAVGAEGKRPVDVEKLSASGWQRTRQVHPHDGAVYYVRELGCGRSRSPRAGGKCRLCHSLQRDATLRAASAEPGILVEQARAPAAAVEKVLVQLKPQKAERIARVVGVGNPFLPCDGLAHRI
jgi:hypothetical protein